MYFEIVNTSVRAAGDLLGVLFVSGAAYLLRLNSIASSH